MGGVKIVDLMVGVRAVHQDIEPERYIQWHMICDGEIKYYCDLLGLESELRESYPPFKVLAHNTGAFIDFTDGRIAFIRPRLLSIDKVNEIQRHFGIM